MKPGVIFDLDQTLLDTQHIEHLRTARNWNEVYRHVPNLKSYEYIDELIDLLRSNSIEVIIITMSISRYCKMVVTTCKWDISGMICYHDVSPRIKPDPFSFIKAIKEFGLDPQRTISAGDSPIDIIASNKAGVPSIACSWGAKDKMALLSVDPTFHAPTPYDLFEQIMKFHNIKY